MAGGPSVARRRTPVLMTNPSAGRALLPSVYNTARL